MSVLQVRCPASTSQSIVPVKSARVDAKSFSRRAFVAGCSPCWPRRFRPRVLLPRRRRRPRVAVAPRTRLHWSRWEGVLPGEQFLRQSLNHLRTMLGQVVLFARIVRNVVKLHPAAIRIHEQLIITVSNRQHGTAIRNVAGDPKAPFPEDRLLSFARLPKQDVAHVFAVRIQSPWQLNPRKFANRRQEINRRHDRIVIHPACGHPARPSNDERRPHATFIKAALASPKRPRRPGRAMAGVADMNILGPVIA